MGGSKNENLANTQPNVDSKYDDYILSHHSQEYLMQYISQDCYHLKIYQFQKIIARLTIHHVKRMLVIMNI